ncbi:DeoR/GlpR family DNA-binding transcription regulator [Corynebacterium sp. UBA2622]|uniref:DeoR/GlpR family DNA-binding transcription regulator n=1 Tax=Corynebacterium sp. UBA2622 TaxID=1946393 RepID=UPI0025BFFA05|nr:DeoR/GlpR family DNA-binding transcription regulator [Corynebacterium sp. UBA2622]
MYAEERRRQIASLTAVEGRVSVTELASRFEVTAETIRRDLAVLNEEGIVHRIHGGAVASQAFLTAEMPLDARYRAAAGAKNAIAEAALAYLPAEGGDGIFLDSGTTVSMLAAMLTSLPVAQTWPIVTRSLPIALELSDAGFGNVQLLGGAVRALSQAVVGDIPLRTLALMTADVAFIGTNALTVDHGLSTADAQEAAVKAAMVTNARKVVVLCDSSKLGTDYLASFATLDDIDVLITDADAPPAILREFENHGAEVVAVSS